MVKIANHNGRIVKRAFNLALRCFRYIILIVDTEAGEQRDPRKIGSVNSRRVRGRFHSLYEKNYNEDISCNFFITLELIVECKDI